MAQGQHKEQKQNRNPDNKPYGTRKYILKQDKGEDRMSHKYIRTTREIENALLNYGFIY